MNCSRNINFGKKLSLIFFCLSLFINTAVSAMNLWLPNIFSDGMVLQRNIPIPVWGNTEPGQNVTVEFSGKSKSAKADENGKWMVKLDAMPASSTPADLKITSGNENKTIKNVVLGDVWICSGQSNMEFNVNGTEGGNEEKAKANYPMIRFINPPHVAVGVPQSDVQGTWNVCTPNSIAGFSAVGYFFGRDLYEKLKVPIGLIGTNWGGTRIEPWTPPCGFEGIPSLKSIDNQVKQANEEFLQKTAQSIDKIEAWLKKARKAQSENKPIPALTGVAPEHKLNNQNSPTTLYNGMVAPYVPYGIKGAIWYQGESNLWDGKLYGDKMKALVQGWRKVWNQGDFPFYFCQIAPFVYGNCDDESVPRLWEGQYDALTKIPNTGMATTIDIGNIKDIHPRNKIDVGKRLALIALGATYGMKDVKYKNPTMKSVTNEGNKLVIKIADAETLKTKDGKPVKDFKIAGKDCTFADATATIDGSTITLISDNVPEPISVKYAWNKIAEPTLVNETGLPLLPFQQVFDPMAGKENAALNKSYKCSDPNSWGWNPGLTDGTWGEGAGSCFATANTAKFPKNVVIDLEKEYQLTNIIVGKPSIGSTKTVDVSVSTDNKSFTKIGSNVFNLKKAEKKAFILSPAEKVRYIKLEFPDHYDEQVNFDPNFIFISEVMAFE